MLPSLSVGGLYPGVLFLFIWPHVEVSVLLNGFDRSIMSTVSGTVMDTLALMTWTDLISKVPMRAELNHD